MKDRVMVIVAGGSSIRFGADKLLEDVSGRPLVAHTVDAIIDVVDHCVLVVRADQIDIVGEMNLGVELIAGGDTRTESEMAGIRAATGSRLIGVHDGARPCVSQSLTERLFSAAEESGGAIPVLDPPAPLISRGDHSNATGAKTVQTPQVFWGPELVAAYSAARSSNFEGQDTADVVLNFTNLEITAVPGDPDNIKVTYPADLDRARKLLSTK